MVPFPLLCRARSFAIFSLLSLFVLALSPSVRAQGYPGGGSGGGYPGGGSPGGGSGGSTTPHYDLHITGGTTTDDPNGFFAPGDSNNYYGRASTSSSGAGKTCSITAKGPLTAKFDWNNGGDATVLPPPSVIISQTCTASWGNNPTSSGTGSGTADNGLSTGVLTTSANGAISTSTLYTGKDTPGASFSVTCTPTATFGGTNGSAYDAFITGQVNVTYSALTYPVTITTTAVHEPSGDEIMVGQNCIVSLSGVPSGCTVSDYQWSVTGTTFQSWHPVTYASGSTPANYNASSYVDGPGPLTNPTASWYWNDLRQTPETVTCTATVTPPPGQGSAFTVTVTKTVTVFRPVWTATGTGGHMQVNASYIGGGGYWLYAGPTASEAAAGLAGGMNWYATLDSSKNPEFGMGTLDLAQISTANMSYTGGIPTSTHYSPLNNTTGLDTVYPYGWGGSSYSPDQSHWTYVSLDAPGLPLATASSANISDSFEDYLMYTPAFSTQAVPIASFHWLANGSATVPNTNQWSDYFFQNGSDAAGSVFPTGSTSFVPSSTFPTWTVINKSGSF